MSLQGLIIYWGERVPLLFWTQGHLLRWWVVMEGLLSRLGDAGLKYLRPSGWRCSQAASGRFFTLCITSVPNPQVQPAERHWSAQGKLLKCWLSPDSMSRLWLPMGRAVAADLLICNSVNEKVERALLILISLVPWIAKCESIQDSPITDLESGRCWEKYSDLAPVSLGLDSRSQPYLQFHYKLFPKPSKQNSELINLSPKKGGGARNALLRISCCVPGTSEPHMAPG